jgi:hypothetical protein
VLAHKQTVLLCQNQFLKSAHDLLGALECVLIDYALSVLYGAVFANVPSLCKNSTLRQFADAQFVNFWSLYSCCDMRSPPLFTADP